MERYFAFSALMSVILLVITRSIWLRCLGIHAVQIGRIDKKDYLIVPFFAFFFYIVLGSVFGWMVPGSELFRSETVSVVGVALCFIGLAIFLAALFSFGVSFRVGLDETHPGELVTRGIFAISRNPIYLAFAFILCGIFLTIPNWILLAYIPAAFLLFHRQVLIEERSLRIIYREAYATYCRSVRRYL